MNEILFTTNGVANDMGEPSSEQSQSKLVVEVDRVSAFGIIEKLIRFVENTPDDSDKATFLTFFGEAHVDQPVSVE